MGDRIWIQSYNNNPRSKFATYLANEEDKNKNFLFVDDLIIRSFIKYIYVGIMLRINIKKNFEKCKMPTCLI